MRPYEGRDQRDGRTRHPAGESREGTALFGGGLGVTPQPLLAPLPAREASGDGRTAVRSYENGERIDGHTYLGGHDAEYGR